MKIDVIPFNGMTHEFISMIGLIRRATSYFEEIAQEIRKRGERE